MVLGIYKELIKAGFLMDHTEKQINGLKYPEASAVVQTHSVKVECIT